MQERNKHFFVYGPAKQMKSYSGVFIAIPRSLSEKRSVKLMGEKLALDVSEAAALLGVSRPTMYQILNRSDVHIDFYIVARRKVSRQALQDWIAQQAKEGGTPNA